MCPKSWVQFISVLEPVGNLFHIKELKYTKDMILLWVKGGKQ